jgi:competence protein ComEC
MPASAHPASTAPATAVGAASLLAGVALAGWLPDLPVSALVVTGGTALLAFVTRRRGLALSAVALACLSVGLVRAQTVRAVAVDDISRFNGQHSIVTGVVSDLADRRERFRRVIVDVQTVGSPPESASGRLQVDLPPEEPLTLGERVVLEGLVAAPPSFPGFDYRAVLERQGIRSTMRFPVLRRTGERVGLPLVPALAAFRDQFRDSLARALPQPQAAIAAGVVVGGREELPTPVREAFARTGASHLLAVSGFNMMLVAAGAFGVLVPLVGRRRAALGALVAIWLFAGVTAGTPAVLRAATMATLGLVGLVLGRQRHGLLLLVLAAAALAVVSPSVIDDVGFQLSVAATAGLLVLARPIDARLRRLPGLRTVWIAPLREAAASTTAAVVATLPIVATTFGTVSLVALPVNVVVAPLIAPAMATAAVAGVAGMVNPLFGQALAAPVWLFTSALVTIVEGAALLPGAAVEVAPPPGELVMLVYLTGVVALLAPARRRALAAVAGSRWRALLALAGIAALGSSAAVAATGAAEATIAFLDGGAVARTPGGRIVVVDGGGNGGKLLAELDRVLPIWDRRVDLYLATSWRPEHAGALSDVARRLPIDRVIGPPLPSDDRRWATVIGERRLALMTLEGPTDIALGDGSRLWIEPATAVAVRLVLPGATIALNEAGRRRGAALGAATDGAGRSAVAIAGALYPLGRHGTVRLVVGSDVRVYVERR